MRGRRANGHARRWGWRWAGRREQQVPRRCAPRDDMMRLEARAELSHARLVASPFVAIVATLAITALFVGWAGAPIGRTYAAIFEGGFGSRFAWSETLTRATPL